MYLPEGMWLLSHRVDSSSRKRARVQMGLRLFRAAKESFGGMRLLRRADYNVGAHVNTFWRMPCRGAMEAGSKKTLTWDNKHITWFGTP